MNDLTIQLNDEQINLFDKGQVGFDFFSNYNKNFLDNPPNDIGIDLLILGISVLLSDRRISREDTENSWTRNIDLKVPVLCKEQIESVKSDLVNLLNFLTGDYWHLNFIKREKTDIEKRFLKFTKHTERSNFHEKSKKTVCMFSGGLDSYIGAIDCLSNKDKDEHFIFCNIHSGGNSYLKDFLNCRNSLKKHFNCNDVFKTFSITPKKTKDGTTRSRSFAFFTHAVCLASCYTNVDKIIIPENGLISLNVPLTLSRYASASTRTTHPYYLYCFNIILNKLNINLELFNPYQFNTKGEMMLNCKDFDFLKSTYRITMSCSHPSQARWRKKEKGHCGNCLPCYIRKASEYRAFHFVPKDEYYNEKKSLATKSTKINLDFRCKEIDKLDYYAEVQKNGPISHDLDLFVDLYKRGLAEIKLYLDNNEKTAS